MLKIKMLFIFITVLFACHLSAKTLVDITTKIGEYRSLVASHASNNPQVLKIFDEATKEWANYYYFTGKQFDIYKLLRATLFAAIKHEGQYRKDEEATPYIVHPITVAHILWKEGKIRSVNVLAAALLHDTLEDTDTTPEEIEREFGYRVRCTVEEVTNDPALSTEENKQRQVDHAPELSLNAQLVKLADRLCNIRDLSIPPPSWSQEKVIGYFQWGEKLLAALKGTNMHLEQALADEIQAHR